MRREGVQQEQDARRLDARPAGYGNLFGAVVPIQQGLDGAEDVDEELVAEGKRQFGGPELQPPVAQVDDRQPGGEAGFSGKPKRGVLNRRLEARCARRGESGLWRPMFAH